MIGGDRGQPRNMEDNREISGTIKGSNGTTGDDQE